MPVPAGGQRPRAAYAASGHGLLVPEDRETLQQREILLSDAVFDPLDNELQNIYACLAQPTERLTVTAVGDISGAQLRPLLRGAADGEAVSGSARSCGRTGPTGGCCLPRLWSWPAATGHWSGISGSGAAMTGCWMPWTGAAPWAGGGCRRRRCRPCMGGPLHVGLPDGPGEAVPLRVLHAVWPAGREPPGGLRSPEIGTFIHYLLENVAREVKNRGGWSQVEQEELRRLVREYIDQYARRRSTAIGRKAPGSGICFPGCGLTACAIVEDMAGELAQSDFSRNWPSSWASAAGTGSCPPLPSR